MGYRAGDVIVDFFTLYSAGGSTVSGAASLFTTITATKGDGSTAPVTITEVGGTGSYKVSLGTSDATTVGPWHYSIKYPGPPVIPIENTIVVEADVLARTAAGSAGTVGAALANLDAAVSSRLSAVSAATPLAHLDADVSTRAAASDWTSARAAKLDNLDAPVSTRASKPLPAPTTAANAGRSYQGVCWEELVS